MEYKENLVCFTVLKPGRTLQMRSVKLGMDGTKTAEPAEYEKRRIMGRWKP